MQWPVLRSIESIAWGVRHTFIIFGLFTTPSLCPPAQNPGDATAHWRDVSLYDLDVFLLFICWNIKVVFAVTFKSTKVNLTTGNPAWFASTQYAKTTRDRGCKVAKDPRVWAGIDRAHETCGVDEHWAVNASNKCIFSTVTFSDDVVFQISVIICQERGPSDIPINSFIVKSQSWINYF